MSSKNSSNKYEPEFILLREQAIKKDLYLVISYIFWLLLGNIVFVLLPKYLLSNSNDFPGKSFSRIATMNLIFGITDIVFIILLIIFFRARILKIGFIICAICKILLFLTPFIFQ